MTQTAWLKEHMKKQKGKDHWTIWYAWAGRKQHIHIWKEPEYYLVYSGAVMDRTETFEEAVEYAMKNLVH